MTDFRVQWVIDVDADCHEAAGMMAQQVMRDPQSIATVFTVEDPKGVQVVVDCDKGICTILSDGRSFAGPGVVTAAELKAIYSPDGGGEHPTFHVAAWRVAVEHGETVNGYWDWLQDKVHQAASGGSE